MNPYKIRNETVIKIGKYIGHVDISTNITINATITYLNNVGIILKTTTNHNPIAAIHDIPIIASNTNIAK